ncbi:MAG: type II toxin-antitoxin system VapC family toxin, partial [Propionibacteriaceae bacterium]|nr:type II toxin-antitoxin system VapC family toxin [Propionibacteriaceae bacterium]
MIGLDTNVVVRYLADDDSQQSPRAARVIEELTPSDPGFIATVVWVETYWILTRACRVPKTAVLERLAELLDADEVRAEDYAAVAQALAAAGRGADFADALIGAAAQSHGCTHTVTFDESASKRL